MPYEELMARHRGPRDPGLAAFTILAAVTIRSADGDSGHWMIRFLVTAAMMVGALAPLALLLGHTF